MENHALYIYNKYFLYLVSQRDLCEIDILHLKGTAKEHFIKHFLKVFKAFRFSNLLTMQCEWMELTNGKIVC